MLLSLSYILVVGLVKWRLAPPMEALVYLAGGLLGIYFLDLAELFFKLFPSPFRSVVFQWLFVAVSFFVVTSSGSLLASGLVLSLYLTMILWQAGEWKLAGNLTSWYRMVAGPVDLGIQRWSMIAFAVIFIIETFLFIR